jgi:hypothetical protein
MVDEHSNEEAVELTKEEHYREEQLIQAGYSFAYSRALAQMPDIDLHVACKAILCGNQDKAIWLLGILESA